MRVTLEDARPGLAVIANCVTPYRVHLNRLIAAGVPELRLHTMVSHGAADFDWKIAVPDEINVSYFGDPTDTPIAALHDAPVREWRKGGRLIDYLRKHDVRAVICGMPRYFSYLRVVLHGHRTGLPVFVRSDANIRNEKSIRPLQQAAKSMYYRWWLPKVAGVMPMGDFGRQFFVKYGADDRRMYYVPYTPDYDFFAAVDSQQLDRFRRSHGLHEDRRYLLYSGRLVRTKRVDLLVDAFAEIASRRPSWDLLIAGDGVLRDELQRRVPEAIRQRVHWLGFLECDALSLAYHACDALVLPSDREPWALVIQEAIAAGMAVVASDAVGAARELVDDRVNGRIFAAGSVDALRESLWDVTDPDQIDRYRQHSRVTLQAWRERIDPVAEIRRALVDTGVLTSAMVLPAAVPH